MTLSRTISNCPWKKYQEKEPRTNNEEELTEKTAREEPRVSSRKDSIVSRIKGHQMQHREHLDRRAEGREPHALERRVKSPMTKRRRKEREKKIPTLVLSKRPEVS